MFSHVRSGVHGVGLKVDLLRQRMTAVFLVRGVNGLNVRPGVLCLFWLWVAHAVVRGMLHTKSSLWTTPLQCGPAWLCMYSSDCLAPFDRWNELKLVPVLPSGWWNRHMTHLFEKPNRVKVAFLFIHKVPFIQYDTIQSTFIYVL